MTAAEIKKMLQADIAMLETQIQQLQGSLIYARRILAEMAKSKDKIITKPKKGRKKNETC